MAIEFFTGFEGCNDTTEAAQFFTSTSAFAYKATGGYDNGKGVGASGYTFFAQRTVTSAKRKAAGGHVRNMGARASYDTAYNNSIISFVGPNVRLFNTDTSLNVYVNGVLLWEYGAKISTDLQHIEIEVFSDATVGEVKVSLDGVLIASLTNVNTGGADITEVYWGCGYTNSCVWDNMYTADVLQGELISMLYVPTSDVAVQFTPLSGTDNFAMIDEMPPDDDTTYVSSNTVNHEDFYGYGDIPAGYEAKAVTLVTVAKKDSIGTRSLIARAKQDATNYDIGSPRPLSVDVYTTGVFGYGNGILTLANAPDGTAWDSTKFNAIDWGFKVVT